MLIFWVEGKTDEYFLKYYLTEQLKIKDKEYKTEILNGCSNIIGMEPAINNSRSQGKLAFLLDGDVKNRKDYKKIKKFFDKNPLDKVFYFKPDDLETFLFKSLPRDTYIDCFEVYEECIGKKGLLSSKSRLYAYWEALGLDFKKDKREGCWEIFNFGDSIFDELETFLKKCF